MPPPTAAKPPNCIWIFGDQHRAQAMSCAGDPNLHTPAMDRLAAEGWRSTAAVSGFPLCGPYRGSLLTSRYPNECIPGNDRAMPTGMRTVADAFNDSGYHTAYFGKWHLDGFCPPPGKAQRSAFHTVRRDRRGGFATWIGYENNNAPFDTYVHGHDDAIEVPHRRLSGYETEVMTDLFIDHLRKRAASGEPFFAALSVQPPHDPYVAPLEWMRRHNPANMRLRGNVPDVPRVQEQARRELAGYYAAIECLDACVDRIRDALEELGLADNTHIVFFSDHGDMHGAHGQFRKHSPWEESIRVPFILGGMGMYGLRRGQEPVLINHVDIAPTSLGLCGIDAPAWMRGTDYSSHRRRDRAAPANIPDSAFLQYIEPTPWSKSTDRAWRGVVTADGWKYVCIERQPWLMFNLNEDPLEQINLALSPSFHTQRKKLQERLAAWLQTTGDRFELPPEH